MEDSSKVPVSESEPAGAPHEFDSAGISSRRRWAIALMPTCAIVLVVELWARASGQKLLPTTWLTIGVVFAAFFGGLAPGLAAASIAWVYLALYSAIDRGATNVEPNALLVVFAGAVMLPSVALMAGLLKDRLQAVTYAEAARRAKELHAQRQRTVEAALRASESRRLQEASVNTQVLDALPALVALFDRNERIVSVNKPWRDFARSNEGRGGDVEHAANLEAIADAAHDECRGFAREAVNGVRQVLTGAMLEFNYEYPCITQGRTIWFHLEACPVDLEGTRGALVMQTDVTARHEAESALAEQRNRLQQVLDQVPAAVYIQDLEGRFQVSNPMHRQLLGARSESDVLGRTVEDVLPADMAKPTRDAIESILAQTHEPSIDRLERWALPGREERVLLSSRAPLQDPQGNVVGVVGVSRDITEIHIAERALRETQEQMAHLFTSLPAPAWVFDTETLQILSVNDAAVRAYGYSRAEFLRLKLTDMRRPQDVPELMETLQRNRTERTLTGPWQHVRRDGSIMLVEVSSLPTTFAGRAARLAVIYDVTERVRERESLLASERHFHGLVDSASALIWMCDRHGRATYFNRAWISYAGDDASSHASTDRFELVHPDDAPRYRAHFESAINSQLPFSMEYRLRRADGNYGWVLEQTLPRFAPDGAFDGLTGSCTDITDLHRAAELLRGSESAMRALLRAIPDPIFRIRRDGTYIGFSARPDVRLMLPPENFLGKRAAEVLPPDIARQTTSAIERTLRTGEATTFEYTRDRDDGMRSFEVRVVTCGDEEVLAIVRDVTDLRRAELALRQSEERLRLQFDRMPMGCILFDGEYRVQEWNPAAERIFGWSASEVIDRDIVDLIVPTRARGAVDRVLRRLVEGDMGAHSTNANITKDGKVITCEWFNTPIVGEDGRAVRILSMVRDVTERIRIEEELRQAQKMDAIGQLASGVAHDFNNLLTAIFGYTNLARRTLAPGHPANNSLDRVEEAARQASGVTRALLTFSREGAAEKRPFPLGLAVRDAVRLLRRTLPSNIDLRADYNAEGAPWIMGDPTQIQQVVLNLTINARDAMPSGGTLRIAVTPPVEEHLNGHPAIARLEVTDSGQGMSDEVQQRIFEPFFTTKPAGEGTGLGLSIVHGIVTDHGGRIAVRSAPGQGTTMTLDFPAVERPVEGIDSVSQRPLPPGKGELILLADNYTYVREIVASMLATLGYRVIQSPDGAGLLASYARHQTEVRLVIADADLADKSGTECLQTLRAQGSQTPAVLIAGDDSDAIDTPNTRLLKKPFQMNELAAVVSESLTYERR
jgi:PAS domain S-box-containing protein